MKKHLPFFLLFFFQMGISVHAQVDTLPIWQGFEQYWGYNHRINRLGDWIDRPENGQAQSQHFAASGSGSDRLDYVQFYSNVQSENLLYRHDKIQVRLVGKEGKMIETKVSHSIPFELHDGWDFEVLLSGFDLKTAIGFKADKFEAFGIQIQNPKIQEGLLSFDLLVQLQMNCSSPECEKGNQEVGYDLEVYWLAMQAKGLKKEAKVVEQNQAWEKENRSLPDPVHLAWMSKAEKGASVIGIRGLELFLDEEQHMLGLQMGIEETASSPPLLGARLKMGFVQNLPSMFAAYKAHYSGFPKLPAKWVVKRAPGMANLRLHLSLLDLPGSQVQSEKVVGELFWKTRHGKQEASN